MIAFEQCHARGFLWKTMGRCNGLKEELSRCLRAERVRNQAANRSQRQDKMALVREKWRDIDENS